MQCFHLKTIYKQKQLVELSKIVQDIGYALITDILVAQVNISNKISAFWQ